MDVYKVPKGFLCKFKTQEPYKQMDDGKWFCPNYGLLSNAYGAASCFPQRDHTSKKLKPIQVTQDLSSASFASAEAFALAFALLLFLLVSPAKRAFPAACVEQCLWERYWKVKVVPKDDFILLYKGAHFRCTVLK